MVNIVLNAMSEAEAIEAIRGAAAALADGGLVAFPTETVYGVAAVATPEALAKLDALKGDRARKPFTVHIGDPARAADYASDPSPLARRLMTKGWPGPLTLVLDARADANSALGKLDARARSAIVHDGTVGLRCPDHHVAAMLLESVSMPVVATSANRAGQRPPRDANDVAAALSGAVDVILDGGPSTYAKPSTVVRVRADDYELLREGVYDARTIRRLATYNMLFVCTGNTCRSPMAEGLARKWIADRFGCAPDDIEAHGYSVGSAGAFASDGAPASPHAVTALLERGVDIAGHQSRALQREQVTRADVIYGLTQDHVDAVDRLVAAAGGKTQRLDPERDIPDPIGHDLDVYREAADAIEKALVRRLQEHLP